MLRLQHKFSWAGVEIGWDEFRSQFGRIDDTARHHRMAVVEELLEKGEIAADDVRARAMRDKGRSADTLAIALRSAGRV